MVKRSIGSLQESKATNWKPVNAKTAQELIDDHDDGSRKFSDYQLTKFREIIAKDPKAKPKAKSAGGKARGKRNFLDRTKGESTGDYLVRLSKHYHG